MTDLDNFFAKKDKKKVKGRKYDNPDEIAKRLKESEKRSMRLSKSWGKNPKSVWWSDESESDWGFD